VAPRPHFCILLTAHTKYPYVGVTDVVTVDSLQSIVGIAQAACAHTSSNSWNYGTVVHKIVVRRGLRRWSDDFHLRTQSPRP
jgi:hypothetical protein